MSKREQEAKIQALRDLEKQFATGQTTNNSGVVPCKSSYKTTNLPASALTFF